jgi:hypothetical protein
MDGLLSSVRDLDATPDTPPSAVAAALDAGAALLAGAGRDALAAALRAEPPAPRSLLHLYLL